MLPTTISPKSATNFPLEDPSGPKHTLIRQAYTPNTPTDVALAFDPLLNNKKINTDKLSIDLLQLPYLPNHASPRCMDRKEVASCFVELSAHLSISRPSQDKTSRMEDHIATLGVTPKDSGSGKKHRKHRRICSLEKIKTMSSKSKSRRDIRKGQKETPTHSREQTPVNWDVLKNKSFELNTSIDALYGIDTKVTNPSNKSFIMHRRGPSQPVIGTSFLTKDISSRLRTSEIEPSHHQIDLPTSDEVLTQARLCALLEDYRLIDQNFVFTNLIGMTRTAMEGFVLSGATPLAVSSGLVSTHVPIVKNLMGCMECGDLTVEGFFHTGNLDGAVDDRMEVAILRSDSQRKIITVWRGATYLQENPVDKKKLRLALANGLETLHPDHLTPVLPSFRRAYFEDDLERQVFDLVNKLVEEYPFFDLVCTGHCFGAALATISASRYATLFPMMRVSCLSFGCPKIGGIGWRLHVHSLPNLKVVRVQHGLDMYDEHISESIITHVGHSIILSQISSGDSSPARTPTSSSSRSKTKKSCNIMKAYAYKFDHGSHRVSLSTSRLFKLVKSSRNKQEKCDQALNTYVHFMKQFTQMGTQWVVDYTEENLG